MARGLLAGREARAAIRAADVVHHPFTVPIPLRVGVPRVVSVMDVQHLDLREFFSASEVLFRRVAYDAAARRADIVITISEFCRSRIIDTLDIAPERVRVAHLGVDTSKFVPYDGAREEFVLYPARAWPHKNHAPLLEAVQHLRVIRPGLRLVLTGGSPDELGPLPEGVEHLGQVSSDELRALYRRASALVFPSLYEGFGLPPLEAMASGCPVASAKTGSLPEICGDAAVFFEATDPRDIARAVDEAIEARSRLVPLGLQRARRFSWTACADAHVDAYRSVARRGKV
jgi:glycosyltransferase involved in cell wall biosynthesis